RQCLAQRPAGAEQLLAVVGVRGLDTVARPVTDDGLDLLAEVTQAEDDPPASQERQLMQHERLPRDLDERLRDRLGDRVEARRETTGEDGDGKHHEKTTRVPSKSNRKRTSSRPASAIAAP